MSATNFTLKIANNTKQFANSDVFIFMSGIDPSQTTPVIGDNGQVIPNVFSAAVIDGSGNVSLKQIPGKKSEYSSWNSNQYTYSLEEIGAGDDGVATLSIPRIGSARIYFSIKNKLSRGIVVGWETPAHVTPTTLSFDGLQPFNQSAANYLTLYDKSEMSFTDSGVYIDTTSVDFFCLPISLTEGAVTNGLTQSRSEVLSTMKNGLTGDWAKLFLTLEDSPSKVSDLRVLAPATATGNAVASKDFDSTYMDAYIDAIWDYYKIPGNTISVDCSEVSAGTYTGSVDNNDNFNFTGGTAGPQSIPGKPTSLEFFQCTNGPLTATNKTALSVIVKCLAAAWNIGILPMPGNPTLIDKDKASFAGTWYTNNPNLSVPTGDSWYNKYAALIHSLTYTNGDPVNTYAFPFDDVLGKSGTIHILPENVADTSVTLTLQDMSNTILPDPVDPNKYSVTFHVSTAKTVSGSFQGTALTPGSNIKFDNVSSPFSFQYDDGDGTGLTECTVDVRLESFVPQTHGSIQKVSGLNVNLGLAGPPPPPPGSKTGWVNGTPYTVSIQPGAGGSGSVKNGPQQNGTEYTFQNLTEGTGQNADVPNLTSPFVISYSQKAGDPQVEVKIDLENNTFTPTGNGNIVTKAASPTGSPILQLAGGGWPK